MQTYPTHVQIRISKNTNRVFSHSVQCTKSQQKRFQICVCVSCMSRSEHNSQHTLWLPHPDFWPLGRSQALELIGFEVLLQRRGSGVKGEEWSVFPLAKLSLGVIPAELGHLQGNNSLDIKRCWRGGPRHLQEQFYPLIKERSDLIC